MVRRSGRQLKDNDSNSKGKQSGTKGSSVSGSTNSDSSGLKKSSREIPSKKQKISLSTRKSERLEKRTPPPTPPIKKKVVGIEKQKMPSPLKKSEKGENHLSSSSSGSRSSEKGVNLQDSKTKKEERNDNAEHKKTDASDSNKGGEKDKRPVRIVVGKKRLDARSYRRSLLTPLAKKTHESENKEKPKDHSVTSQGDAEATSSKEDNAGEGLATDGSCSLQAGKYKNNGEMELSQYSRKRKIHSDEVLESNHGETSTVAKCSYTNSHPSPESKEVIGGDEKAQADPPRMDSLLKMSSGATEDGKSISSDRCTEKTHSLGSTKRKRESAELYSDASVIGASEDIHSSANLITSSLSESKKGGILESCDTCSKRQRFDADSQKYNMCSCNCGENQNSCNNPSSEEVQEKESILTPENDEMPMRPAINDDIGMNVNTIDNDSEEPVHGSESLPIKERNCEHDQADENTMVAINSLKEDEGGKVVLKESESLLENDHNTCVVCKIGGKLLCCDGIGCRRNYHVDCLKPLIKLVPFGIWHCPHCVQKKIQFGVHSVSEGVESIWDVKEEMAPDCQGVEKHYLVKYKGLAHVHNHWIPEHQLHREAPSLIAKFNRSQVLRWNLDWTRPQRLLRKRDIISQDCQTENFSNCRCEWYVKWCGLGYEYASWELENASFLNSPEARIMMRDYETRLEKAVLASNPSRAKILEKRKLSSLKLSELPCSSVVGPANDYLSFVNKLREYWRKNQNAVVVEDQDRIRKIVLFILSIQSDVCRPFLVISTPSTLSFWEAEFLRSAPSVNVVVYDGTKEVRESIRALEFYEDSGCVMLQVLLAPIDAVIEDVDALEVIGWEAIIVDECQCSTVSRHFEQIKNLTNGFRILLPSGPIKEDVAEYLNLLSFIESGDDRNGDINTTTDPSCIIRKLKERFSRFVACDKKSDATRFVEYWVPAHLSNVQLEQYCATLLSNSIPLCSYSKNDPIGVLQDTLISIKKCCNHPYLVDPSLQNLLTKDLPEIEYLDIGVKASGKLQVLDKILLEVKKKDLRVLIVFQAKCGSGKINIGDILDDFVRQRFGPDSYERIDSLLSSTKKQAALKTFNRKESGRFVFLIENRACSQSIKLSSVDMVILFDSDWNPSNDLRALQKITIDSQFEQIKVFRLFSSYTVEEKVLSLAKQDMALDSSLQNWTSGTSHTLLLCGAKLLFKKLEEFHNDNKETHGSSISSEPSILNLVREFLNLLPDKAENHDIQNSEIILRAHLSGATYSKDLILPGEKEVEGEELPHLVWKNLLDGRYPSWRYSSGLFQRSRRKIQNFDQVPKKTQENDETGKKRKKVASANADLSTINNSVDDKRKSVSTDREGTFDIQTCNGSQNLEASPANTNSVSHPVADQPEVRIGESSGTKSLHGSQESPRLSLKPVKVTLASMDKKGSVNRPVLGGTEAQVGESNEEINLHDSHQNLHLSLKPAVLKLCEIIEVSEEVKSMAGKFVEYIVNNHNIVTEPLSIFQAFQISLCWSVGSLLKQKIRHKKSLSLAKEHLHFQCTEEETDLIYSKLRTLKKLFSANLKSVTPISTETMNASQTKLSSQHNLEDGEIGESSKNLKFSIQLDSSTPNQAPAPDNASGSSKTGLSKSIKKVNKTYSKRIRRLYQKQIEELDKFNKNKEKILEKEKADLIVNQKLESALICSLHSQSSVRSEKLKLVDQELMKKMEELKVRMEMQLKNLEDMQKKARNEEARLKDHWLQEAQCGRSVADYATLPLSDSGFREEHMVEIESDRSGLNYRANHVEDIERGGFGHEKAVTNDANEVLTTLPSKEVAGELSATIPDEASENFAVEPASLAVAMGGRGIEHSTLLSKSAACTVQGQQQSLYLSDSSSASLEQSLIDSPLDRPPSTRESEVSLFQVPVGEHAQTDIPVIGNHDTPVRPPAAQLQESSSADLESDKQSRPIHECSSINQEQMNESIQQSEAAASEQDVIDGQSVLLNTNQNTKAISERTLATASSEDSHPIEQCQPDIPACKNAPLPCHQFSLDAAQQTEGLTPVAATPSTEQCQPERADGIYVQPNDIQLSIPVSQQTEIPAPVVNPPSTEQCQPEVASSRSASNQFSQVDSQQTEVPAPVIDLPSSDQSHLEVATSVCSSIPDNCFSQAASQRSEVPASSVNLLPTERCQVEVATSLNAAVPDNQFNQVASQHAEVPAPATNLHSSEQCQLEIPIRLRASLPDNRYHQVASLQNEVPAPAANPPSIDQCQLAVAPSTRTDHEASNENYASSPTLLTQVPSQSLATGQSEPATPTFSQTNSQLRHIPMESSINGSGSRLSDHRSMSSIPEVSHRALQVPPAASRSSQHLFFNPLQNEVFRIRREEEQATKMHEDEKLRLNSEFEKEIEEIRKKYNTKLLEAEAEFMPKKKAFKTNFNLAYMNQILFEVIRQKTKSDGTVPGAHGAKQGAAASGSMQQVHGQPGSMQQVHGPPQVQVAQRPPVSGASAPTTMTPPVQAVHQPSALFSTAPVRSQLGQGVTPPRSNQIMTEVRAPAPHLQSFRPMVSQPATTASPHASMFPVQQSSGNITSTSIPPPQMSSPNIMPFSRAHHPVNTGRLQGTHNHSFSPVELLQGIPTLNSQAFLHPIQDLGQIIDTYDTAVRSSASTDVVCLSDDD